MNPITTWPTFKAFWTSEGPKWAQNGLKTGSFYPFVHAKWSTMRFGKCVFDPFLTHFWSQNSPFSRHFGIFGGPKWASTSSKRSKNTCSSVTHGLGSFLRKVSFLPLLDPVDPFGHPRVSARACSLPQPSGPRYWGLGVRLGNSEGWQPQKVGGCGWSRCPRNHILSHQRYGLFLVCGRQHLELLGAFLGCFRDISWS